MRILVASLSDVASDPRPHRVLTLLQGRAEVAVLGYGAPSGVPLFQVAPGQGVGRAVRALLLALRLRRRYLAAVVPHPVRASIAAWRPDTVVCHDLLLAPVLRGLLPSARLVLDLREFYPRHYEQDPVWRLLFAGFFDRLCRSELPRAQVRWTVSPGLAQAYAQEYGADCVVLPSLALATDLRPGPVSTPLRLVHHGAAARVRGLEAMIAAAALAHPHVTFDLYLVAQDPGYWRELHARAAATPNVRVLAPVPYGQILPTLNAYDLGVFLCPPATFNLLHALPNKFFEFIQARLGIVIGPSPDMAAVLHRHGLGVEVPSFEATALANALRQLTPAQVAAFKKNAEVAAASLSFEAFNAPRMLTDLGMAAP